MKITDEESPILIPYPSWEANTIESDGGSAETAAGRANAKKASVSDKGLADNSTIISTFRIRVDECDRLWVMDTGLADILGSPKQIAPPALVIFDLKTDQLIKRYSFPPADSKPETFFANVVSAKVLLKKISSSNFIHDSEFTYFLFQQRLLIFRNTNVTMHSLTFPTWALMELSFIRTKTTNRGA